jgi:hypothetical protein
LPGFGVGRRVRHVRVISSGAQNGSRSADTRRVVTHTRHASRGNGRSAHTLF